MKYKIAIITILLSSMFVASLNANETDFGKHLNDEMMKSSVILPHEQIMGIKSTPRFLTKENKLDLDYIVESVELATRLGEDQLYEYTYNPEINILTELKYVKLDGNWEYYYRINYTFNENLFLVEKKTDLFEFGKWKDVLRSLFILDENDLANQILDQRWKDGIWIDEYRHDYKYDEMGNIIEHRNYGWVVDHWDNSGLYKFSYNTFGSMKSYQSHTFIGNEWNNYRKIIYSYDHNQNILLLTSYDWQSDKWKNYGKIEYTYNSDDQLSKSEDYYWEGAWKKEDRDIFEYDESGNQISNTNQVWIYESGNARWEDITRTYFIYNENNLLVRWYEDKWENNSWQSNLFYLVQFEDPRGIEFRFGAKTYNKFTNALITWSIMQPSLVQLSLPEDESTAIAISPLLEWASTKNAETYSIQIAENEAFEQVIVDEDGITELNYSASDLQNYKTYYWRVRGDNSEKQGDWSTVWSFRTISLPPVDAISLVSPANETVDEKIESLQLTWDASKEAEEYTLQVSTTADFEENTIIQEYTGLSETIKALEALEHSQTYYWRVRGVNEGGSSPWSEVWSFETVVSPPEDRVVLASPVNFKTDVLAKKLELLWEVYETAETYTLHLSQERFFNHDDQITKYENVTETTQILDSLKNEAIYYWRVKAINKGGEGPWSETWKFTTEKSTSIEDTGNNLSVSVSPNPTSGNAIINYSLQHPAHVQIIVFDEFGNTIQTLEEQRKAAGVHQCEFSTDKLSSGVYYYSIQFGSEQVNGKIIKVK
jgi:type IX secretion system substrate protein